MLQIYKETKLQNSLLYKTKQYMQKNINTGTQQITLALYKGKIKDTKKLLKKNYLQETKTCYACGAKEH